MRASAQQEFSLCAKAMCSRKSRKAKMELKITAQKPGSLGVRATVTLVDGNGQGIYCDEVRLWNGSSRQAFIDRAIESANGHLNEHQRIDLRKRWDAWLM